MYLQVPILNFFLPLRDFYWSLFHCLQILLLWCLVLFECANCHLHCYIFLCFVFSSVSGTISIISSIPQSSALQILTKIAVFTFSPRPSLAKEEVLTPAFSHKSCFFISRSINSFQSLLYDISIGLFTPLRPKYSISITLSAY